MNRNLNCCISAQQLKFITEEWDMIDQDESNESCSKNLSNFYTEARHQFGTIFNIKGNNENVLLTNKGMTQQTKSQQHSNLESVMSEESFDFHLSNDSDNETIEILNSDQENNKEWDEYIPSVVIMSRLLK